MESTRFIDSAWTVAQSESLSTKHHHFSLILKQLCYLLFSSGLINTPNLRLAFHFLSSLFPFFSLTLLTF